MNNSRIKLILGGLGLYLVVAGISYWAFTSLIKSDNGVLSPETGNKRSKIDTSAPKTEACPLNGKMYTKGEKDVWVTRRPLAVMIENHEDSRPQSGLSKADVVYEALAEGGVTRFMAVFYCGAAAEEIQVGPVRSARMYFMDWASEYATDDHPLYTHVGGANKPGPADALGNIKKYGWDSYNDMNQFSIGFPTFWRDYERLGHPVATEHTMYSTTDKLYKVAEERGLTNVDKDGEAWDKGWTSWTFKDGAATQSPKAADIKFAFWSNNLGDSYAVRWTYDVATNTYKRENGGQVHKDFNTDEQLATSNVVVMFQNVKGPIDELKHVLYDTTGTGKVLVFQNGDVVEGTWKKPSRTSRTVFMDKSGKELSFVRGHIWVTAVDTTTKVTY